jgi:LysR family hydrogen peroxide-inducible transcriptional activator
VLLVERSTRQVVMTEAGKAVAEQARTILAQAKEIRNIAHSFEDPMSGDLHVGLIPTLAPYLLPLMMPSLRKRYPKLKLWLHEYQTQTLLEKLRNADLDLLILALPVDGEEDFAQLELFREPFQLAVPADEELASHAMIQLGDLEQREMLLLEEGHCLREHARDVCFTAGAAESHDFHASSLETLRHMVGEGMGMTLMPELAVPARQTKSDSIRYIEFADPKPGRRIGMLYRKGSYRKLAFEKIAILIKTLIEQRFEK